MQNNIGCAINLFFSVKSIILMLPRLLVDSLCIVKTCDFCLTSKTPFFLDHVRGDRIALVTPMVLSCWWLTSPW